MNRQARPVGYDSKKNVETTWGALTMRWGGVLLAVFIVFHLFHFTGGMVGFQPGQFEHLMVYQNVVAGFSVWPIALFYIIAMCALCLHLDHGIWSMLQTLGWVNSGQYKESENVFQDCGYHHIRWFYLSADFGARGLGALRGEKCSNPIFHPVQSNRSGKNPAST